MEETESQTKRDMLRLRNYDTLRSRYGELMEGKIPYPKFLEIMDSIGVKVSLDVYYFDDEYSEYSEDDPMNDDYN